ncbi:MAG: hypothetical protein PWP54_82 [Thermosipho sp. (in: thermotogales)]|nr:hypothetical protein [Thermosipho sp. (in: thermotogales)]MDN5324372.1 hypothetical protein [Thermosipho sp. (in: thermotogales)]
MKRILLVFLILFSIFSFANDVYSIKMGETSLGTSVLLEISSDIYKVITTIEYGTEFVVESTTTFEGPYFKDYVVSFSVDGTLTGEITGNYDGKVANFVFESQVGSNTVSINRQKLVILDNNFILSHFLKIIEYPAPTFELVIPQLLFNPSKTEYAVGKASLKKDGDIFEISYQEEKILITFKNGKILKIEYPSSSIIVELVDSENL